MKKFLGEYFEELLLYSGQYALFYLIMYFSKEGFQLFSYKAHFILLLALLFQVYFLTKYGNRFIGSLICPVIYTLYEISEFSFFITNIGHFFFWVFSLIIAILQVLKLQSNKKLQTVFEFITVFMNVIIFVFIYMYFDLMLKLLKNPNTTSSEYNSALSIVNFKENIIFFFKDKAHIYIALGGMILGISLGIGRIKIFKLKEKINDLFGKYMDKSIRDTLIENNGIFEEKRKLCILFSDIRNFTELSEQNESSKIIESLNQYFSMWDEIAYEHGGIINKYIGDAVMIIFGLQNNDNPEKDAVECSIKILNSLNKLNEKLENNDLIKFESIGIGIHSGELILGNVGSSNRKEFTVIGDVVNTSSRLESLCKDLNQNLIISKNIYSALDESVKLNFYSTKPVLLKGKSNKIKIYSYIINK